MFDPVGVGLLIALVAGFTWLAWRAWRSTRRAWKFGGGAIAGVLALASAFALVLAARGYWKLNRRHPNPVASLSVVSTPERLARGEQLAAICAGCHAADGRLPLEGNDFLGDDAPPVGELYAPNLTPVHLRDWSDGEIVRAVREGVSRDGRSLLIMPSELFRHFSDYDVESIVAFLRSQPPVTPDTPRPRLNVLGAIMANVAPIFSVQQPIMAPIARVEPAATPEYGRYLVSLTCVVCHGDDLQGIVADAVPGLSVAARTWSDENFATFFQTGARPSGLPVDSTRMPWRELRDFAGPEGISGVVLHLRETFPASPR